jgi:hypothetical protein
MLGQQPVEQCHEGLPALRPVGRSRASIEPSNPTNSSDSFGAYVRGSDNGSVAWRRNVSTTEAAS